MKPQRKPQTPEVSGRRMNAEELAENKEWLRKHPEREPTRKDVANLFLRLRDVIAEDGRNFAFRQGSQASARQLADRYDLQRAVLERYRVLAREQFPDDPALPGMPSRAGNDFYALADYCTTAAGDVLDGRKAPTAKGGKADSKKQPWADDAPEFLPNSEALKLDSAGQLDLKKLGRLLTPKGDIRYMRKGRRCKIHLGDFRHYLSAQKGSTDPGDMSAEVADEYVRDIERRKEEVARRKRAAR